MSIYKRRLRINDRNHGNSQNLQRKSPNYNQTANIEDCSSSESLSQYNTDSKDYHFNDLYHSTQILMGLNNLRQSSSFCDVTLCVDGEQFKCHKVVLASFSPYFKAMFNGNLVESQLETVPINGIEAPMMKLLINFAYTADIAINKSNVQSLLSASNLLEVLSVRDACCEFLEKNMDESNCVGIHCFAEAHACLDLQLKAKSFVLEYFSEVVHQEEFLTLPHHELVKFICNDTLSVSQEEEVFEAVVSWLNNDPEDRGKVFHEVLEHVRLPLISPYYLLDYVETLECIKNDSKCMELVEEAKKFHLLPDRRTTFISQKTRPRKNSGFVEVLVTVGGEDDKVVSRSVECFNPRLLVWQNLDSLPFAISKHGLVSSGNNMLYLIGGEFPDGTASKAMWRYDPVFDAWQELSSMNSQRSEIGVAIVDGFIYAVGGWNGTSRLSSVEQYNPQLNSWVYIAQMKIAVSGAAVVSYNGKLIVAGGIVLEDGNTVNSVQSYDPKSNQWSDLAPLRYPKSGSATCVMNNFIYVIGGWNSATKNTNLVECYDPIENRWFNVGSLIKPRHRPGAAVVDGKMYVCGGELNCDKYHETIETYDQEELTWKIISKMTAGRSCIGCASLLLSASSFSEKKV